MAKVGRPSNSEIKRKKILKTTAYVGLFLLVFGLSYALFNITLNGRRINRLSTGNFSVRLTDKDGVDEKDLPDDAKGIELDNAIPITDDEGKSQEKKYEFNIVNDGSIDANFDLYLETIEGSTLNESYIKYELIKNNDSQGVKSLSNNKIDFGRINSGETSRYELRIWLDYDADNSAMNKVYQGKLKLEAVQLSDNSINNNPNPYIVKAFTYSENGSNYCVSGEEDTCVETKCYLNKQSESCPPGTIIAYKVSLGMKDTILNFNVIYDYGEKMSFTNNFYNIESFEIDSFEEAVINLGVFLGGKTGVYVDDTNNFNTIDFQYGVTEFVPGYGPYTLCDYYEDEYSDKEIKCLRNSYVSDRFSKNFRFLTLQEFLYVSNKIYRDNSYSVPLFLRPGSNNLYGFPNFNDNYYDFTIPYIYDDDLFIDSEFNIEGFSVVFKTVVEINK